MRCEGTNARVHPPSLRVPWGPLRPPIRCPGAGGIWTDIAGWCPPSQEVFAARQNLGKDLKLQAHAIHINALSGLGDVLKSLPKQAGSRGAGKSGVPKVNPTSPTLSDLGIDKKTSAVAQQLAALPEPIRHAIAARETTLAKVKHEPGAHRLVTGHHLR